MYKKNCCLYLTQSWNNNLKPMSMLEKGEDGEWK